MKHSLLRFAVLFPPLAAGLMSLAAQPLAAAEPKLEIPSIENQDGASKDRALIQKSAAAFCKAFNRGDANAIAALWTEDGDYVDEAGQRFAGRAAIEQEYASFFAQRRGTKIRTLVDSIRILNDNTAIEDGRAFLEPPPEGAPATSRYMAVHTKVDGKWLMSTVRDSRVETPSAYGKLQVLSWLIGSWSAEARDVRLKMSCQWVANKSFIQRNYSVTDSGEVVSSGIQIIGWDPVNDAPRSWTFASEGGTASGAWTPRDDGWEIANSGVSPDGTTTRATNILTRVDDGALTWQSVDRVSGEERLPDEPEVLVRRDLETP